VARSRSLRAAALGALLTLGGAQFGSIVHAVVAAHATCAEHGELIEAEAADAPAAPATGEGSGKESFQAGDTGAAHGHDHCRLALSAQPRATWQQAGRAVAQPAEVEPSAVLPPGQPLPARVAVWRVAPKSSPPARA